MVQPSNVADVVQEFIAHLALEPEKKFFLGQNDPGESFALPSVLNVILNNRVASLETLDVAFRGFVISFFSSSLSSPCRMAIYNYLHH